MAGSVWISALPGSRMSCRAMVQRRVSAVAVELRLIAVRIMSGSSRLKQVFDDKSSRSSASASSILTSFTSTSSTSTVVPSQSTLPAAAGGENTKTSAPESNPHKNNAGVIAGAVIATVAGVAVLLAGFCYARRRSPQKAAETRIVETKMVEGSMLVEACAMSHRYELSPSAPKNDIQELPGIESGGLPAYSILNAGVKLRR